MLDEFLTLHSEALRMTDNVSKISISLRFKDFVIDNFRYIDENIEKMLNELAEKMSNISKSRDEAVSRFFFY